MFCTISNSVHSLLILYNIIIAIAYVVSISLIYNLMYNLLVLNSIIEITLFGFNGGDKVW